MEAVEIRLRIVEAMVPHATRVGLTDPEHIVKSCTVLEKYVLDFQQDGNLPNPSPKNQQKRSARATEQAVPGFLDPTRG